MSSQQRTTDTPRGDHAKQRASMMAVFTRLARKATACLAACISLAQGIAFAQYPNPNYNYLPYPTIHPYAAPQPVPGPGELTPPQLVPENLGWLYDFDSPIDLMIRETARGAYMRLEYLNWDIQHPGSNLLGAPIESVANPRDPFIVQTQTGSVGVAESLSTRAVDFQNINGIRGTVGIPLNDVTLEGSFWGLSQGFENIEDRPFLRNNNAITPRFIAVGLQSNGVVGDRTLLFDKSFGADYKANAWGSDVNLYYHFKNPRQGFGLQPLAGFRFFNYDESLAMTGVFDNSSGAFTTFGVIPDPFESKIRSVVNNNVYSAQVGFKADFKHEYFTLAFEPKLAFGANDYQSRVSTKNLRSFDDPTVVNGPLDLTDPATNSVTGRTVFSPTIDLGFAGTINLTDWFRVRCGYNIIWTGNIARANSAIYYNDLGNANPPAVAAQQKTTGLLIQGLSVGGEILLP